ncbi:MAG: GTP-binding protein [Actinobacteria bacterium]|nr:GTP-binding protein [Actinomycetota bacterium]
MSSPQRPCPQAALLTPLGPAGVTVLQVIGAGALDCVGSILRDAKNRTVNLADKSNRIIRGYIIDPADQQRIDEVLVHAQHLAKPNCELVDICCHGGVRPGQKIMEALALAGAHPVGAKDLPGAGFAGLIDRSSCGIVGEVLDHVCHARTDLVVRILLEQLEGGLTAGLNRLLSEDLSAEQLLQVINHLLTTWTWGKRLTTPATIAVTGPTNAGKSSLANLLSGQRGSIVTSQPGTTRDWVSHHVSLEGLPIVLIDTAGHREPADALEAEAIARAVEQSRHADVQLFVIDGTSRQAQFPDIAGQIPTVLAVNKADLDAWSLDAVPPELAKHICIRTSAVTGLGRAELTLALLKALGCENLSQTGPVVFTKRQQNRLQRAAHALQVPSERSLATARNALSECLYGDGI